MRVDVSTETVMTSRSRLTALLLIGLLGISACGQKGPLFLPGDSRQVRPQPPAEQNSEEDDEESSSQSNRQDSGNR